MHDKPRTLRSDPHTSLLSPETHPFGLIKPATPIATGSASGPRSSSTPSEPSRRSSQPSTAPSLQDLTFLPSSKRSQATSLPVSPYQEYPGRSQSSASASHAFKDALQNLQGAGQDSALNGPASGELQSPFVSLKFYD